MPEEPNNTAAVLAGINAILVQVNPLVGVGFTTAHALIALLKHQGVDVAPFEAEMVQYEAAKVNLGAALADFRKLFPAA